MTLPVLHWSMLKHLGRSPAHYRHALTAPQTATPAMRLGTEAHRLLLGPGPHKNDAPVVYDGERRGNAWKLFKAAHPGVVIVTQKELDEQGDVAEAMADAVRSDAVAMRYLVGAKERSLSWTVAGRECAGHADVLGDTTLVEVKTGADISPARYYWTALRMGYFGQLGWYHDGIAAAGLPEPTHHVIVAVESKPPFPVVVYELTSGAIDLGRKQWRVLFERLRTCEDSNEWPGYAQAPIALDVPESDDVVLDFGDAA